MSSRLSALRAQLVALQDQARELADVFLARGALLPGCVYTLRRRCGKATCRCARGELHATEMLSYRGGGRPQNITPRPGQLAELGKLTEAYQRFRRTRAQWVKLHRQVLAVIDAIQARRVEQGERRFRRLRAGAK